MTDLAGATVEAIVGDDATEPAIVWFKMSTTDWWHRTFVDVGTVFWEEWDDEAAFDDFRSDRRSDLAGARSLVGGTERSVTCGGNPPAIVVATQLGTLRLEVQESDRFQVIAIGS